MAGKMSEVSNTEPLKQIIFKYDAELNQCEIDKKNQAFTIDSMAKTCK